jgi:hypothetical protein
MLLSDEIEKVLTNKGLVKLTSSIGTAEPETNNLGMGHVDYLYKKTNLSVSEGVITLNRVSNDAGDRSYDCVNVITTTNKSCLGVVRMPGYVYTDNFSGCVFYLYKNVNYVIGVHAHQGLDTVHTTERYGPFKLFTRVVNAEVRKEYGPREYMNILALKELCRHETRGELTDEEKTGGRNFLAFLSCVELSHATTFLYVYSGGMEGNRVVRLVDKFTDEF